MRSLVLILCGVLAMCRYQVPQVARSSPYALAKFEPEHGCLIGAYIDFDPLLPTKQIDQGGRVHKLPEEFESVVGKAHAIYSYYQGYGKPLPMDWVKRLAGAGKYVQICLEPNDGLDKVRADDYLTKLADDMKASGARIFLRFASEMNAPWVKYGGNPELYRAKFKLVHDVMAVRAPNVAMVWCPYSKPQWVIPEYYPGDDAVDWVGVNFYNVTFHDQSYSKPGTGEDPRDFLRYVYRRYATRKPVMICEYAATHYGILEGERNAHYAERCIKALYRSLPTLFPRVKAINYFDGNNLVSAPGHDFNNFSITEDDDVLAAYCEAVASAYFLSHAPGEKPVIIPMTAQMYKLRQRATVKVEVCAETGLIATKYCPVTIVRTFKRGTEPKINCTKHHM